MSVSIRISKLGSPVLNPQVWILVILFGLTTISQYHELLENVPIVGRITTSFFLGLEPHTVDRLIYVLLTAYAGWVLGVRVGAAVLLASLAAMLPPAILVAPAVGQALWGAFTAVLVGALLLLVTRAYHAIGEERDKQREAVEKLRLSEENYRELFQNASDAIWVHDLEGNLIAANSATERMSGYALEELVRMNVRDFLHEDAKALAGTIKHKLLKGEPVEPRYEQRLFNRREGKESIVELTTRLIRQGGKPVAFQNIARDVTEERKMRDGMRFYLQKVLVAQEEERKRIARDLHDDTAQSLMLLMRRLDAIISASHPKYELPRNVKQNMNEVSDLATEILTGLRRYAQELRPAILDDMGLVAALEWMADNLGREGTEVVTELNEGGHDLSHEAELGLFRIAQEALANVRRHAEASKVVIRLEPWDDSMRLVVNDNGKGFEVPTRLSDLSSTGMLGIMGMQERAYLLGGTFRIESEIGKGTSVSVDIPVQV
jgi:PAS domain S-box-containing protein